jgi:hypothetical protein
MSHILVRLNGVETVHPFEGIQICTAVLYELCEAKSGYVWIVVYTGAGSDISTVINVEN